MNNENIIQSIIDDIFEIVLSGDLLDSNIQSTIDNVIINAFNSFYHKEVNSYKEVIDFLENNKICYADDFEWLIDIIDIKSKKLISNDTLEEMINSYVEENDIHLNDLNKNYKLVENMINYFIKNNLIVIVEQPTNINNLEFMKDNKIELFN